MNFSTSFQHHCSTICVTKPNRIHMWILNSTSCGPSINYFQVEWSEFHPLYCCVLGGWLDTGWAEVFVIFLDSDNFHPMCVIVTGQLTMGRVGPRVTSLGNSSGFEWRVTVAPASHRHCDILRWSLRDSVTAYYLTPGDESVTHDTVCLSPGPGCCTKIISANPDPGPGIAGNFQPSHDVTWSSQSDLGSHYNHSLTKDEAEELQELSQGKSAEGQSRDNARDDVSTNWLESEVSGVGWSGLGILSLNDLSNLKLI